MVKTLALATIVAGLVAASAAYEPTCRPEGDRCEGASGYPGVEWIPCCEGYECSAPDTSYGGYGKLCAKKYAPKCRPEGDRCEGAAGYPGVDWIPCCDGYTCSAKDTSKGGYGKVCAAPVYTTAPPPPKCRAEGDRCMGAPGYPGVDWIPCCKGYECSADDMSKGGYGKVCAAPVYTTAPPPPKCRAEGDRCMGAPGYPGVDWIPCCKGYECSADDMSKGGYGKVCAAPVYTTAPPVYTTAPPVYTTAPPVYTTAPPVYTTMPPKCVKEGVECDLYGMMKCCKDLECVESGKYDYTYSCEPAKVYTTEPPTTTTTAPKCGDVGEMCGEYMPCCDYAQCVKDDYGNSSTCKAY